MGRVGNGTMLPSSSDVKCCYPMSESSMFSLEFEFMIAGLVAQETLVSRNNTDDSQELDATEHLQTFDELTPIPSTPFTPPLTSSQPCSCPCPSFGFTIR